MIIYKNITIKITIFISSILAISAFTFSNDENSIYNKGEIGIIAYKPNISFPEGIVGLFFDTTDCENCSNDIPHWRFIDSLLIDSISVFDYETKKISRVLLNDSIKAKDIHVNSPILLDVIKKFKIVSLKMQIPSAKPGNEIKWDDIRKRYWTRPDFSIYYKITFDEDIHLDSIVKELSLDTIVTSYRKIPKGFGPEDPRPQ